MSSLIVSLQFERIGGDGVEGGDIDPETGAMPVFMMGAAKTDKSNAKSKADRKIGDERISEMKGETNRNTKNERHNYTVGLRQKKR